jgi:hypothetical protein
MVVWTDDVWALQIWLGEEPSLHLLDGILTRMEGYSGIQTVSDHVCEPGMDTITSPMKQVINQMEKQ